MTFEDFCALPDLEKLVIVEIQPRQEIQNKDWIYDIFSGVTIYGTSFTWGEPVRVTENAIDYYWKATKDECYATPGSFYFDPDAQYLWIHTSDGDAPNEILSGSVSGAGGSKYCIMVYFWICLTNYQPKLPSADTPIIDFIPQDATLPVYYLPYLPPDALGSVRQAIGEYHVGDVIINDADLKANNDGFWYKVINECYLENAIIEAKVGDIRASYAELALFFTGFIRNKDVTDEQISFSCKDRRMGRFRDIPLTRFDKTLAKYANLEDGADGQVIPIPFGRCYGCNPVCIDTVNNIYKPSAYAVNAITAVYDENGTPLAYVADAPNGEFTLGAPPAGEVICDIEGILCDMTTGLYSANIADLLYYLLVNLNDIPATEIDVPSFLALKAARGQTIGYWAGGDGNPIHTLDVLRIFQMTGMFHLVPNLSNLFEVRWFEAGSDSLTPIFYQDEFPLIGRRLDADRIRQKVVVNYRYNPSTQKWLSAVAVADKTIYRFSEHEIQTINTALVVQAEADSLAQLHLDLLRFPGDFAFGRLPARSLNMLPAEKIILNKLIVMETGEIITVFQAAVYRLFSLDKNLETGEAEILAINESQATGNYHADVPHVDSYSDIPHGDGHGDSHMDSHADQYDDWHIDTYYDSHGDSVHTDFHEDHADGGPYFDSYLDIPHSDIPHWDQHGDYHLDEHIDDYVDEYSDLPHQDYLHVDSHSDIPHSDAEY